MEGSQENIIEKIESDNSKIIKEIDKRQSKNNNKNPLYLPPLNTNNNSERARSLSPNNNNINNSRVNTNISQTISNRHRGIFNKYSILREKVNTSNLPRYMKNNNEGNKENDIDNDYRELLNKKNEYVSMINRLEDTIREVQKTCSRKNKNISNTVNDNSNKLTTLKQKNSLIKNEIEELEKILLLTQEEMRIKKEIKTNESKFIKINQGEQSITANNILKDLSNMNEDDERKKSIYQSNNNIDLKNSKNDIL